MSDLRRSTLGVLDDLGAFLPQAVAAVALVLVGAFSLALATGNVPSLGGKGGGGGEGPTKTSTPTNVVVVDPRSKVPGSIAFAKAGNIWVQSGDKAVQITTGGLDAMPTWAPDGSVIYFIRTTPDNGHWPVSGVSQPYYLHIPALLKVEPRAGATPVVVSSGKITRGQYTWHTILRQPAISPDGRTAAVITDGPDPAKTDVVLKLLDLTTGALTDPRAPESTGLGHDDPAWSPDGRSVYFVKNARNGTTGASVISRLAVGTLKAVDLSGPGYIGPSVSPDGRLIAATRTDSFGTDVAVLDATTGAEVLRVTRDGRSFSPVWSPAGDSLAFLRIDRGVVDLLMVRISGAAPEWKVGEPLGLTISAGLDPMSHPAWYIPADLLPKPTPTPTPAATGGPSTPASGGPAASTH